MHNLSVTYLALDSWWKIVPVCVIQGALLAGDHFAALAAWHFFGPYSFLIMLLWYVCLSITESHIDLDLK